MEDIKPKTTRAKSREGKIVRNRMKTDADDNYDALPYFPDLVAAETCKDNKCLGEGREVGIKQIANGIVERSYECCDCGSTWSEKMRRYR